LIFELQIQMLPPRIYPARIYDPLQLSALLSALLKALAEPPLEQHLDTVSHVSAIPKDILQRLVDLQYQPDDAVHVKAQDFHVVFANILFHYPTVRMYGDVEKGEFIFER
jgi:hypothetical protein